MTAKWLAKIRCQGPCERLALFTQWRFPYVPCRHPRTTTTCNPSFPLSAAQPLLCNCRQGFPSLTQPLLYCLLIFLAFHSSVCLFIKPTWSRASYLPLKMKGKSHLPSISFSKIRLSSFIPLGNFSSYVLEQLSKSFRNYLEYTFSLTTEVYITMPGASS